jgi:hypothetical protein
MRDQSHFDGAGVDRVAGGERKGRCAEVDRVNAQQNMMHDGVSY